MDYARSVSGSGFGGVGRARTTADLVADALREEIRRGELAGGRALTQQGLAARFGVSRIPVREALRRLESEGLVVVLPNRGAVVVELSPEEVREVYEVRALLEGDLLRRAVPLLTVEDLRRAEAFHEALDRETDAGRRGELNREFHSALYGPAGRPRQRAMVESLAAVLERYRYLWRSLLDYTAEFQPDHRRILECCRARDAEAAREALEAHLAHAAEFAASRLERDLADRGESEPRG